MRTAFLCGILLVILATTAFGGWVFEADHDTPPPDEPWGDEFLPTDHLLYRDLERLAIRGEMPLAAWTLRSLPRLELAWMSRNLVDDGGLSPSRDRLERTLAREGRALGRESRFHETAPLIEALTSAGRLRIRPYIHLTPRLTIPLADGKADGDWSDSTRIGLRGTLYLGRSITISHDVFVGEVAGGRGFSDPLVAGTDILFYTERFDLTLRTPRIDFRFGRDRHRWGPGAWGTLLLDDHSAPYTFAQYDVEFKPWFRFRALSGSLDYSDGKYLAAHRLSWTPSPRFELSFSEGARYQSTSPGLLYTLGFIPYTFVERMRMQDAGNDASRRSERNNVLWALGWSWRTRPAQLFYGEILADDIASKDSHTPSRWGFLGGYSFAPRFNGWDWTLGVEASKIFNYTYSVYYRDQCLCDWDHQERGLGHPDGPDSERLLLRALVDFNTAWGCDAMVTLFRHGQGALGRPWYPSTDPESEGQPSSASELWDPVTGGASLQTRVRWEPRDNLAASFGLAYSTVRLPAGDSAGDSKETRRSVGLEFALKVHL
ncbi:MAG: capsule assembly Wzi family protein [Candidatus Eisenbacteria bacterium]|nr:capsule assembly Wzi family protein [Candidatus Eisenbacteria bacterium]MBU1947987.1 capsule assembly Wzi family protein [Candidatus Eisenbacteria bacterium]